MPCKLTKLEMWWYKITWVWLQSIIQLGSDKGGLTIWGWGRSKITNDLTRRIRQKGLKKHAFTKDFKFSITSRGEAITTNDLTTAKFINVMAIIIS